MTLRHMKIFLTVYQTQNMTHAADILHMTQPAVTRAIKEIETYYGVCLFERMNKRLFVTESGKYLYSQALHLVDTFESIEKGMRNWDTFGILRIGATITLGNFLLPQLIFLFQKQLPNIQVQVTIANRKKLQKMLLSNELDIALIEGGVDDPHLRREPFGGDKLVLITPPYHPLLAKKQVSLKDLLEYPLLLREKDSSVRIFLENLFAVKGLPPLNPRWESASTQAIIRAVSYGLGISLLPEQLVGRDIAIGTISACPIKGENLARRYYLVWDTHKFLTKAAKQFMALCKEHEGENSASQPDLVPSKALPSLK